MMSMQSDNRRGKIITVIVLIGVILLGMIIGAISIAVGGPTAGEPESLRRIIEVAMTLTGTAL